jgi:hypothetical protein
MRIANPMTLEKEDYNDTIYPVGKEKVGAAGAVEQKSDLGERLTH